MAVNETRTQTLYQVAIVTQIWGTTAKEAEATANSLADRMCDSRLNDLWTENPAPVRRFED